MLAALHDALSEATRLGHQWVGPEHVLLAVLDDRRPSVARSVLNALGLNHATAEQRFLASLLGMEPSIRSEIVRGASAHPAPVFYEIQGWVAGFAAANGTSPTPETVLLALCWVRGDTLGADIDRGDVVAALAARRVAVPASPVPLADAWPVERRRVDVPIDKLDDVRSGLVGAGLRYGFNTDAENGRAWVIVETSDDTARRLIATILGAGQRDQHSPSASTGDGQGL